MSLNQLFPTDEKIDEIKQLLNDGMPVPKKYQDFAVNGDNDLVHVPTNLIVLPKAEINQELTKLYKNDVNMLGKGVAQVYKYIQTKFINITRQDIEDFLYKQKDYTLTRNINKVVNKPIIEKFPNNRWQVDTIDMKQYANYNYKRKHILNCVDVFSRKCWLRSLINLTSKTASDAMESIFKEAKIKPNIVQSDNGKEFMLTFKAMLKRNNIKQVFNNAYSPNENAIVERSNMEVRKILKTLMVAKNSLQWYKELDLAQAQRNGAYNSTIKATPDDIWVANKEPIANVNQNNNVSKEEDPQLFAKVNLVKNAIRQIAKYKQNDDYKVGDKVRVKMSAIFNNIRKLLKGGDSKQIVVTYTPDIFKIVRVQKKDGVLERNKYVLESENETPLTTAKNKTKYFYASDFIPFNEGDKRANITMAQALKLNKVETNRNDVNYMP